MGRRPWVPGSLGPWFFMLHYAAFQATGVTQPGSPSTCTLHTTLYTPPPACFWNSIVVSRNIDLIWALHLMSREWMGRFVQMKFIRSETKKSIAFLIGKDHPSSPSPTMCPGPVARQNFLFISLGE